MGIKHTKFIGFIGLVLLVVACGGGGGGTPPANPALSPPSQLTVANATESTLDLHWADNSDNEDGFEIYRSDNEFGTYSLVSSVVSDVTSYTDTGLTSATAYWYKVLAFNVNGNSDYSNAADGTTLNTASALPVAPSGLSVANATSSSLQLNWTDNSDNEQGFRIYRSGSEFGTYSQVAVVSANTTSYTNTGLASSTSYWYKVLAYNSLGDSVSYSNAASGTTSAPAATLPAAPSGLSVGSATSSSLQLNWADNSSNEQGFRVYRASSEFGAYSQIATIAANATSYVNSSLSSSTTYWYKVVAYNSVGNSGFSNAASGTTQAPAVTVPNAPSGLSVGNATSSSLRLNWTDNSSNEQGFRIYRSSSQFGSYSYVGAVSSNVTIYTNTGLNGSTTYWYLVLAYNTAGNSGESNAASGTTLSATQSVTLNATNDNLVMISSTNSAIQTTVYQNAGLTIGCNWVYSTLTGLQDFVCAQSLAYFNLSAYAGKTIDSATLRLTVNYTGVGYYPRNWQLKAMYTNWSPSSVTWNVIETSQYVTGSTITLNYPTYANQVYNIDVTNHVQNWVSGNWNNYGWLLSSVSYLFPYDTSYDAYEFFSREDGGGAGPKLLITYH